MAKQWIAVNMSDVKLERCKTCHHRVCKLQVGHFVSVNVVPGSWRINAQKSCALLFELSGSTLWRQQWLTSVLLKRLLRRALATTIQDERKESTKGVATRPAARQGELLATTSSSTQRRKSTSSGSMTGSPRSPRFPRVWLHVRSILRGDASFCNVKQWELFF